MYQLILGFVQILIKSPFPKPEKLEAVIISLFLNSCIQRTSFFFLRTSFLFTCFVLNVKPDRV